MPIYTRTGDQGSTSLIGGVRIPKHHARIEALGAVDELMAFVALLRDAQGMEPLAHPLREILAQLMACTCMLASERPKAPAGLPQLGEDDVLALERAIDALEASLPPHRGFVLPGGHPSVSLCHVARAVCRRAEREVARLNEQAPELDLPLRYLNRLSDYLFALSFAVATRMGVEQILWRP